MIGWRGVVRKHLDKRNTTNREKSAAIPSVADKIGWFVTQSHF